MRGDEDVFPAVEVPVEGGVGDAHRLGDARHARAGQTVLGDQAQRLLHDLGPSFGAGGPVGASAPPPSRSGRGVAAGFTRPR